MAHSHLALQDPAGHVHPVVVMERAALDRWGRGDPQGYLSIMADEVSYFDPFQAARLDGIAAIRAFLEPLTGTIRVDRFEMLQPRVQEHGPLALLTFNLLSYQKGTDGVERVVARWNATETYVHLAAGWRIVHSHLSFITPELKGSVSEAGG